MRDENFFTFYFILLLHYRENGVVLPRMTPPRQPQADPDAALLRAEVERLRVENQLLRDKISDLIRRLYDKKSEALDPAQLALPFAPEAAGQAESATPEDPGPMAPARKRSPNKPRDLSHLEVRETVIVHDEVRANPDAYREIQRIVTDRFDYQPPAVFIERTVRVVHVAIRQPDAVPLKPPAPRCLELSATARMVAYATASKYCHHRPHYRTAGILRDRHGVEIPRHRGISPGSCKPTPTPATTLGPTTNPASCACPVGRTRGASSTRPLSSARPSPPVRWPPSRGFTGSRPICASARPLPASGPASARSRPRLFC
jgi:hypothetical protein